MATLREIRRRIAGVRNTQKITKAMKMVAAARFRRAQEAIIATRPYARKMNELMRHLAARVDISMHPLLAPRPVDRVALVVVTADRGLCGAFNSNLVRAAVQHLQEHHRERLRTENGISLVTVGKKGFDYFNRRGYAVASRHVGIFIALHFGHARSIVDELTRGYVEGRYDLVEVVYNEFKSVIQQKIVIEQLLPIPPAEMERDPKDLRSLAQVDYIYEPSAAEIINTLVPRHLNYQMWRMLLESNAAEQGARMTAMDNATENARELIRELTLRFNNARQAAITKELLEIVGGADALKKVG